MRKIAVAFLLILCARAALADEVDLFGHKSGIWSIAGTADKDMWVVIHNLEEARTTGVFHIEVIAGDVHDPGWKIERVVEHMAISESALAAGVLQPLERGAVYPESFDDAYRKWKKQNGGRGGFICNSTLTECMGQPAPTSIYQ